ncbi:MAG: Gfo/Idh/MocA family oxidoreductase [Oscillospiraceae bacterium]|nr:Gfo/Idh/MocA family oxidoreductase [Oscillospiraceae bacterium]
MNKNSRIRWGIIGTGRIAHTFAEALSGCEDAELYAVASRTAQKANDFAEKFGFLKAYGSYAELAQDEKVDIVYIASDGNHGQMP